MSSLFSSQRRLVSRQNPRILGQRCQDCLETHSRAFDKQQSFRKSLNSIVGFFVIFITVSAVILFQLLKKLRTAALCGCLLLRRWSAPTCNQIKAPFLYISCQLAGLIRFQGELVALHQTGNARAEKNNFIYKRVMHLLPTGRNSK